VTRKNRIYLEYRVFVYKLLNNIGSVKFVKEKAT